MALKYCYPHVEDLDPAEREESWHLPSFTQLVGALVVLIEDAFAAIAPWLLGFLLANVFAKLVIGRSIQVVARLMN